MRSRISGDARRNDDANPCTISGLNTSGVSAPIDIDGFAEMCANADSIHPIWSIEPRSCSSFSPASVNTRLLSGGWLLGVR